MFITFGYAPLYKGRAYKGRSIDDKNYFFSDYWFFYTDFFVHHL